MKSIIIKPTKLNGTVVAPPSKSIGHRAIICAGLCDGERTVVENIQLSEDIQATIGAMKAMGAQINEISSQNNLHSFEIVGNTKPKGIIFFDAKDSGSTLRFLLPVALCLSNKVIVSGSSALSKRPLKEYYDLFRENAIEYRVSDLGFPLEVNGSFKANEFVLKGNVSSQFVSGMLLSFPIMKTANSKVLRLDSKLESKDYVNLTIDTMRKFGVNTLTDGYKAFKSSEMHYKSCEDSFFVEGDYSQGAFYLVANAIGNTVEVQGLNPKSLQGDKKINSIIQVLTGNGTEQEKAGVVVRNGESYFVLDVSNIPDLIPIICVLASVLPKTNVKLVNGARARLKESDRLHTTTEALNKLGADLTEFEDGIIIRGNEKLKGGATVASFNDHRIAMAVAIASTVCEEEIILEDCDAVNKSYPTFWEDFAALGGNYEFNMGK